MRIHILAFESEPKKRNSACLTKCCWSCFLAAKLRSSHLPSVRFRPGALGPSLPRPPGQRRRQWTPHGGGSIRVVITRPYYQPEVGIPCY